MFKVLSICLLLSSALAFTACTKDSGNVGNQIGCAVQDAVVNTAAIAVANGLECADTAAIVADLKVQADKLKICEAPAAKNVGKSLAATSVLGDICVSLGTAVVNNVASSAIPASWKCSATAAKDKIGELISKACAGVKL